MNVGARDLIWGKWWALLAFDRWLTFVFAWLSGTAGTWAGVVGGLWLDYFGPRSTCLLGGIMNFIGARDKES
jgi:hypothetical protein